MGVRVLRKIQLGDEGTAGTATASTQIWRGTGILNDETEIVNVEEDIGQFVPKPRNYIPSIGATLEMDEQPATYELIPYILAAGMESMTTGSLDGTSVPGYIWQFDMNNATAQTPLTFTLEMGDDQRVDEMAYGFVEEFTISGASQEAVMMSANWRGRQATDAEFTTGLSLPTVEEIIYGEGKFFLDAAGGTLGDTPKTSTLLGFSLTVNTGKQAVWTADGDIFFTFLKSIAPEMTGELIMEHNATAEAEIAIARAGTAKLVRLTFEGTTFNTAGSSFSLKTLRIDMAIQYTEVPSIDEQDGDDILTFPFRVVDSDSTQLQIVVVNDQSALT